MFEGSSLPREKQSMYLGRYLALQLHVKVGAGICATDNDDDIDRYSR